MDISSTGSCYRFVCQEARDPRRDEVQAPYRGVQESDGPWTHFQYLQRYRKHTASVKPDFHINVSNVRIVSVTEF